MVKITDRVRSIEVAREEDGLRTEVYILDCKGHLVLIDVGHSPLCIQRIESELRNIGKTWKDIKLILITHAHSDHIDNLPKVLKLTGGSEVRIGEGDVQSLKKQTGVEADVGLKQGDYIDVCGGIEVINIPGHTKGNLVFYLKKEKVLIVGDTIFGDDEGNIFPPPKKYCDDVELATRGIKKLHDYDFDYMLLSHGLDITKGAKEELEKLLEKIA